MAQTTIQNAEAIRLGSMKIEVGATVGALQDFGAIKNGKWVEAQTEFTIDSDNAGEILAGVSDQKATITADWLEPDLAKLNVARGGIDTYTTTAASPVSVTDEAVTFATVELKPVALLHANGDGTVVSTIVVTDYAGTTTYDLGADYTVTVDANGKTCLSRPASGSDITDGQICKVDYAYTPNASKNLSTGGKRDVAYRVVRLTNLNDAGKKFELTFYKARIKKGMEMSYKSDKATEANVMPIEIEAICDISRTAGDQLLAIVDEQGA